MTIARAKPFGPPRVPSPLFESLGVTVGKRSVTVCNGRSRSRAGTKPFVDLESLSSETAEFRRLVAGCVGGGERDVFDDVAAKVRARARRRRSSARLLLLLAPVASYSSMVHRFVVVVVVVVVPWIDIEPSSSPLTKVRSEPSHRSSSPPLAPAPGALRPSRCTPLCTCSS